MESTTSIEPTVLIVDDDELYRRGLHRRMSRDGLQVLTAADTRDMDRCMADRQVDVVILDVRLPGEDGLSACRRLSSSDGPPVILVSVLDSVDDKIRGLDLGAARYLSKPCNVRELIAHVRAVQRRRAVLETREVLWFGRWRIDLARRRLTDRNGQLVGLTDGEFAVLSIFVTQPRRVLSRDELIVAARGAESEAFDRSVDVQISRIRSKLEAPGNTLIRTVRKEGYMLVEPTRAQPITLN